MYTLLLYITTKKYASDFDQQAIIIINLDLISMKSRGSTIRDSFIETWMTVAYLKSHNHLLQGPCVQTRQSVLTGFISSLGKGYNPYCKNLNGFITPPRIMKRMNSILPSSVWRELSLEIVFIYCRNWQTILDLRYVIVGRLTNSDHECVIMSLHKHTYVDVHVLMSANM